MNEFDDDDPTIEDLFCSVCGKRLDRVIFKNSVERYGVPLCYTHLLMQRAIDREIKREIKGSRKP